MSTMDTAVINQETAIEYLTKIAQDLSEADSKVLTINRDLRNAIVRIRPTGALTVTQMADAVGCDRNRIDSIWSVYGRVEAALNDNVENGKRKQTRVTGAPEGQASLTAEYRELYWLSQDQKSLTENASLIRAERDRIVTMVYASKILGPTAIAAAVGVDRNHVLRLARRAGVTPQHRTNIRNQHSK